MTSGASFGITNLTHQVVEAASACIGGAVAHHGHDVGGDDELTIRECSGAAPVDGSGDQVVEAATRSNGNLAATRQRNEAALRKLD